MGKMDLATANRKLLIKMAKGEPQRYEIRFSIDIKGNITIWGGEPCEYQDCFIQLATEDYLHLYDGWKRGGELSRMEREAGENLKRADLVRAFLEFRQKHPTDGYGMFHGCKWLGRDGADDGLRAERDDREEMKLELKKRNRQYIFELYGEKLPLDFDFKKDYEKRLETRYKSSLQ